MSTKILIIFSHVSEFLFIGEENNAISNKFTQATLCFALRSLNSFVVNTFTATATDYNSKIVFINHFFDGDITGVAKEDDRIECQLQAFRLHLIQF